MKNNTGNNKHVVTSWNKYYSCHGHHRNFTPEPRPSTNMGLTQSAISGVPLTLLAATLVGRLKFSLHCSTDVRLNKNAINMFDNFRWESSRCHHGTLIKHKDADRHKQTETVQIILEKLDKYDYFEGTEIYLF